MQPASTSQKQVLAELAAKQQIIRQKFRKAYGDRKKRERNILEAFEPIEKKLVKNFKPEAESSRIDQKKKKTKNGLEYSLPSTSSVYSSIHSADEDEKMSTDWISVKEPEDDNMDLSSIFKNSDAASLKSLRDEGDPGIAAASASNTEREFQTPVLSEDEKRKQAKKRRRAMLSTHQTANISIRPKKQKANTSVDRYTYEVELDYERDDGPDPPHHNMVMRTVRTDKVTGMMSEKRLPWRDIPHEAQSKYLLKRNENHRFRAGTPKIDGKKRISQGGRRLTITPLSPLVQKRNTPKAQSTARKPKKGSGVKKTLDFDFIPYNKNDRIIYEYFDDPNELCNRLRLLVSSRMAGNTNHTQEINSIVEELRELKCIS